ncbi:hypothetical protein OS493_011990 [Desmophyllum pertusum]|uniref:Uncharacterized protein n=1 Tax=Desmophyllum pertusum TaxID=174260 RepID=A0A9X0A2N3_9CNID|nr:hypothetical protein OS493_011990 [Desmophyllum pertusum]
MAMSGGQLEATELALQVAGLDDSKAVVEKAQTKAEKRKAKQVVQLERHKVLYKSINSYSKEVASSSPDLSPLGVLKTAIQLHQHQPKELSTEPRSSKALPLVQAPIIETRQHQRISAQVPAPPLKLDEKLGQLKAVLPLASDVKLVTLLARENGDMNAVVQKILEEPTECDALDEGAAYGGCRVIDLTNDVSDNPSPSGGIQSESVLSCVRDIDVEVGTLRDIMETVKEKEASQLSAQNLLSFHRPRAQSTDFGEPNVTSELLSTPKACPYCKAQQNNWENFCDVCGGVFAVRW